MIGVKTKRSLISIGFVLCPSLVYGANETIIPPSDGSPLIGLNAQSGDNKEIYANGKVTVTNATDSSANTGAKDQQSIVTIDGGSVNLGIGSTIQSTDGWTAKKPELNGVGSWASGSSFKAQDLTIDLATSANSQASAVSGIGPLGTGVSGVEDKSNVSTVLTGTTNINIKSDSNSWIAGGVYWGGAGGNIFSADILNINVSSTTIGNTPSDRNGVFGLESVGNNSVSYNQANVNISDDVKNDSLVGVWGGVGGLSSGFSIKGGNTNITLNGGNSGQRLTGFGGVGVTVEGDTNVTLNSGGDSASLIGINAGGQFNISNETNKSNALNVIIDSKGYANNAMYGIYQSASTGTFYASTDAVRVINKDNVLNGSHLIYSKGDLQINTKELVVRDESANSFKEAIKAEDGAKISLSSTQSSIKGDMITAGTGRIDHQSDQGEWTGYANDNSTGTINLQLGNKALGTSYVWNMTDSSVVSSSQLNNTTVNFTNQGFTTLKTDDLSGSNNVFNMKTDLVAHQGDLIDTFLVSGEHKLNITNQGSSNTNGTETLTVVKTNYDFSQADFSLTHQVEAGAYQYGLRESPTDSTQLELYSTGKKTSTATSAASFLNIGYLTNYIENQTLLQRLGDVRNNEAVGLKSDGFWMKGFGGKLSAFSGSGLDGFDMTYTGTQMGIDKHLDVANGSLLVGAMAGFTRTNPNYKQGDGNGKNYTAGLYATYFLDNGVYVDSVLKYNSMRNHFNVEDTAGSTVKGTSKTHGISLSTEVGKRFWLADGHQGIYLEPQAQLSYGYQSGDSVHASNGLKVGLSHYNSTLGRASVIAGYQIRGQNPINIYVKTGIVREMSGGSSYRFNNGEKNGHTFRSSWFDNGIGANININKKHNIYAEADYSTGGRFDNAMLNVGYRYSF